MKKAFCTFICIYAISKMATAQRIQNPVRQINGDVIKMADPCVYESKGTYYLVGTGDGKMQSSGFDYYTSTDLITWKYGGELYRKGSGHFGSSCFWAPEVKEYHGKFYLTYSCYDEKEKMLLPCIAVSDHPDGGFKDLYTPWFNPSYSAIDGHIFVDDDGTPYYYFSKNVSYGDLGTGEIYVCRLKGDLSGPDGVPQLVSRASQKWEKVNWAKNRCNEAPWVFKRNGKYYMTYSANDTGYEHYGIGVETAKSPMGPWKKYKDNPLMTSNMENGISSPGHNAVIKGADGNLYIVYHRHADANCKKPNWDRVICIDRLYFDKSGKLKIYKE